MNTRVKKILYPVLTVSWMGLIFFMSSRTGEESSGMSDKICMLIGSMVIRGWKTYTMAQKAAFSAGISFAVRKAAHMTEYAVLMILLLMSLKSYGKKGRKIFFTSLFICFLYAAGDEFHQSFVGGRGPSFRDVMIDTAGAVIGGLLVFLFCEAGKKQAAKGIH